MCSMQKKFVPFAAGFATMASLASGHDHYGRLGRNVPPVGKHLPRS
jgi:hypothetical protein